MLHFAANLKPYTFAERRGADRFGAYLLSADYALGHLELAAQVKAEQRLLIADNGNVDLIRDFAKDFAKEGAKLDKRRKAEEAALGRLARPGELSASLQAAFEALARKIAAASKARIDEAYARSALRRQRSMDPDFLIGMEDLTLATLTTLSVEPEYALLPGSFLDELAKRPLDWGHRSERGDLVQGDARVLAGLHAMDFDGARRVGRLAAEAGQEGIAVGLVGALRDRNYVDFRIEEGQLIPLGRKVPRPYLRVMELATGLLRGYQDRGKARPAFHALGAGTPILVALLGSLAGQGDYFACDSTAPIVDGWSSPTISLYVREPAPMKYRAYKIAASWIEGGRGWDCDCHDCRVFHERHPPDFEGARRWWKRSGQPKIRKQDLERQGALAGYLPFLSYHPEDALRREAALARVGHNHQMLLELIREIRALGPSKTKRVAWSKKIANSYAGAARSASWARAVAEAQSLAQAFIEAKVEAR